MGQSNKMCRLQRWLLAGLMVAVGNIAVVTIFGLTEPNTSELTLRIAYVFLNGVLTAASALAGLYILTLVFNLPTALKLAEQGDFSEGSADPALIAEQERIWQEIQVSKLK